MGLKFLRLKRRLTRRAVGLQISVTFNENEVKFLEDYLNKSLEIAIYNQNQDHAMMLQELVNKLFNGYLDAQEPEKVAWLDEDEKEVEANINVF